jgi:hypothetical protein
MKICKCCGQKLRYKYIKYDSVGYTIQFIGKSYDDEIFNIWESSGGEHLNESDAKQGRWEDRRKLFK